MCSCGEDCSRAVAKMFCCCSYEQSSSEVDPEWDLEMIKLNVLSGVCTWHRHLSLAIRCFLLKCFFWVIVGSLLTVPYTALYLCLFIMQLFDTRVSYPSKLWKCSSYESLKVAHTNFNQICFLFIRRRSICEPIRYLFDKDLASGANISGASSVPSIYVDNR